MAGQKIKQPDSTQLKGADGTFETVTVKGVRVNAHEYDEEEHGPIDKGGSRSSGGGRKSASSSDEDFESYTVEELKKHLDKEGIEYTSDDLKDDLVKKAKKGK